ncbi:uncharacterized protein EV154DRAFT_414833 [Mucor mucedo]|uniref:uncharacterized protein n=1 Tax=Mucor mucedo TaxID=29922 RepID=UPI002220CCC3|nr:uncharacterized protein EV154DRAFT_414833 [Mucor mucedo]KAI7894599.1 hypothetical protein EV154DRAFT_414833 [Mucor mucedo]
MSQEYDVFSSVTDFYENVVDTTLCSDSEDLLLNLIHLTKESKNTALRSQAQLLGLDALTDKQLVQMPIIIGRHVQQMNAKVYQSIENIVTLYWHTIWDPKLLTHDAQQEDLILSFLSSFNGIVAKKLIEEIDDYELLEIIKSDIINTSAEQLLDESTIVASAYSWLTQWFKFPSNSAFRKSDLEVDFLRHYLSEIRTNLLMELHIQFMDFFSKIETDIFDQLSSYYDQ